MEKAYGRVLFLVGLGFAALCALQVFSERAHLPVGVQPLYFSVKSAIVALALAFSLRLRKNPYDVDSAFLMVLTVAACSFWIQWFRPVFPSGNGYLLLVCAIFYPLPRRRFLLATGIWTCLYGALYFRKFAEGVEIPSALMMEPWNVLVNTALNGVLAVLVNFLFTAERAMKETALMRFSHVGRHSSRLVHDLKSMLAAPKIQVDLLAMRAAQSGNDDCTAMVTKLQSQIGELNSAFLDLNQLIRPSGGKTEAFRVSEAFGEASNFLRNALRGHAVSFRGDCGLVAERGSAVVVFMNLLSNSIEAMRELPLEERRIEVECLGTRLLYRDVGPGFDAGILKKIRAGHPFTASETGTGIGLYLVKDAARAIGARVRFRNRIDRSGAEIELRFSGRPGRARHTPVS